ncbi:PTS sugar transporter subunit IIA [Absiella sp. AM29-15]|uniref:PTS sugar transporter subunit IIA n=1 Tax=Absiella sp. AM29-15 TaxID=2292278 RepID=UPI000E3FCCE8|nr:PTS N-acetylglucosamine transporter subunit IIBC [Absiella sp. AM29-15]RGC47171.1 PTS N-acetylglucosamine transporter subunit IIBC [Absiella sp. AM29-15]
MRKIIIASHHRLAEGMADTLNFLSAYPNVSVLNAYVDEQNIDDQIQKIMEDIHDEEVFIFTDMLGGSVTQKFVPYMDKKTHLICGMNLPLVLTIALGHEEVYNEKEINELIQEAREALLYVNTYKIMNQDDDE